MTIGALQAAKHACAVSGWTLSNLQLQKILYLAHMIYAGRTGRPLVRREFEAWDYGPVIPSVYRAASIFGAKPVRNVFHAIQDADPVEHAYELKMIEDAVAAFSTLPPFKLVEITHDKHSAWARHYDSCNKGKVIPFESIRSEYNARFSTE